MPRPSGTGWGPPGTGYSAQTSFGRYPAYFGKACGLNVLTRCVDSCVLGTNPGADCTSNADCTGGGTCPGGIHGGGRACDEDSDCTSGNCSNNPRVCGNGRSVHRGLRRYPNIRAFVPCGIPQSFLGGIQEIALEDLPIASPRAALALVA